MRRSAAKMRVAALGQGLRPEALARHRTCSVPNSDVPPGSLDAGAGALSCVPYCRRKGFRLKVNSRILRPTVLAWRRHSPADVTTRHSIGRVVPSWGDCHGRLREGTIWLPAQ